MQDALESCIFALESVQCYNVRVSDDFLEVLSVNLQMPLGQESEITLVFYTLL